jgi:hypothetical protein
MFFIWISKPDLFLLWAVAQDGIKFNKVRLPRTEFLVRLKGSAEEFGEVLRD